MFFKTLKEAFKVKDVRARILFTIFILFVFRLGAHITVPGVNVQNLTEVSNLPFLNMMNLVSGNAMQNYSLFAMGVSPYITASIIVQLLQMDILPKFVEWSKQGEIGRRKLNQATHYLSACYGTIYRDYCWFPSHELVKYCAKSKLAKLFDDWCNFDHWFNGCHLDG